ncbi:sigma-70 family RNA polymerase sigma factor [Microbacterium sp.]|uniref:sigma-70 family RNA polymerase sigma factor n=1 Tax=Microbacterium sp. TaxID=51671 RepID=UPI0026314E4B|nr:sigma-70 family RNA polymerase sigma factor [Microbacterium sp.]
MAITATQPVTIDELIRTHGPGLLNYTTRLLNGDRPAAEDVVQETWVRAWKHLEQLAEQKGSVRGWLLRVAHNIAMDQHRARRARPAEVGWSDLDTMRIAAPNNPEREVEERILVENLLQRLSEQHRKTIIEVYFADHTANGAASVLGVPVGTIKSRVFHALRTMRSEAVATGLAA